MHRFYCALTVLVLVVGLPESAEAQVAELEETFSKLDKKLPAKVWDGKTLNISKYDELLEVKAFIDNYKRLTVAAREIWNRISGEGEERTDAQGDRIDGYIDWMNPLIEAYNAKAETIKEPWYFPFIGPDVSKDKPFVVDTVGQRWTRFGVLNTPGPSKGGKRQPTRYRITAEFVVYYQDMAPDDVVLIQPTKGGKKLGPPKLCKMTVFSDMSVAAVECDTHPENYPDYKTLYSAAGDIDIKVTYRRVIEGKEFKNFESLLLRTIKLPQHGTVPAEWGADHDMELGPSIIQQYSTAGNRWGDVLYDAWNTSASYLPGPYVMMRTMFKTNGSGGQERVACIHGGKRIFEGKVQHDWSASVESWKGNDRDTSSWRLGVIYMTNILSRPMSHTGDGVYILRDHPGEYKCVITGGGEVLKELYFTVNAKGHMVKPPCQAQSITAPHSITLPTTKLNKPYNKKWDKKLAAKRAYGGGATWTKGCPPTK